MVRVPKGETLLVDFEINCKMVHVHELDDGHAWKRLNEFHVGSSTNVHHLIHEHEPSYNLFQNPQ